MYLQSVLSAVCADPKTKYTWYMQASTSDYNYQVGSSLMCWLLIYQVYFVFCPGVLIAVGIAFLPHRAYRVYCNVYI